jgi:type IV pilus assembly protein PilF
MIRSFGMCLLLLGLIAGCSSSSPVKKDPSEPSAADIYVQKGVQYMENGEFEFALSDLQHAIDLDANNIQAFNAMAVLNERLNRPSDAEANYQRAIELNGDDPGTLNNYGRFLCGRGDYDKAMGYFRRVIDSRLYKLPWVALTNAGLCAKSSGHKAEAEEFLRKALESNPAFAPALLEMAKLSLESGQFMSARAFLQRYEVQSEISAESAWLGIQIEHALGSKESENEYFNTLRSRFPDSREASQARKLAPAY